MTRNYDIDGFNTFLRDTIVIEKEELALVTAPYEVTVDRPDGSLLVFSTISAHNIYAMLLENPFGNVEDEYDAMVRSLGYPSFYCDWLIGNKENPPLHEMVVLDFTHLSVPCPKYLVSAMVASLTIEGFTKLIDVRPVLEELTQEDYDALEEEAEEDVRLEWEEAEDIMLGLKGAMSERRIKEANDYLQDCEAPCSVLLLPALDIHEAFKNGIMDNRPALEQAYIIDKPIDGKAIIEAKGGRYYSIDLKEAESINYYRGGEHNWIAGFFLFPSMEGIYIEEEDE